MGLTGPELLDKSPILVWSGTNLRRQPTEVRRQIVIIVREARGRGRGRGGRAGGWEWS